LLPTLPKLPSL
nr:Chain B, Low-density lipoprotein receptor-related protein 2 [Rattus norvegicus]